MPSLREKLYEEANTKIQQLLDEAEFIIVVDPKTKKENLEIETTNQNLEEWLRKREECINIAHRIQQLPSKEVLADAKTKDLQEEWVRARYNNLWLSRYFFVNRPNVNENEKEILEKKAKEELNKYKRNFFDEYAKLLHKMWELLDAVHPYMKREFALNGVSYPFETSCDLFFHVLKTKEDNRFRDKTRQYHRIDVPKWGKFWKLITEFPKSANPSQQDIEKLLKLGEKLLKLGRQLSFGKQGIERNYNPSKHPEQWFDIAVDCCKRLSEKHTKLSNSLKAFYEQAANYAHIQEENAEVRLAKGKVSKSVTWKNGKKFVDGKGGTLIPIK